MRRDSCIHSDIVYPPSLVNMNTKDSNLTVIVLDTDVIRATFGLQEYLLRPKIVSPLEDMAEIRLSKHAMLFLGPLL